jgi:sugar lactone lactonase YvrE
LAGSNFRRIITTDIKWPNGLTIDFDDEKLYWADAFYNKIEKCDFDGNFRQVLSTG